MDQLNTIQGARVGRAIARRACAVMVLGLALWAATPDVIEGQGNDRQSASLAMAGIAHVAIRTAELDRSLRFYQSLGFVRAFEFTKEGKPTEEFIKINDRQFIELYPVRESSDDLPGFMHVCFEAKDLGALNLAYRERGLEVPPVQKAGAGNLLFSTKGPDGTVLEFTQYMPDSMHTKDRGQHLGSRRISDRLVSVTMPVKEADEYERLFTEKLGFVAKKGRAGVLMVPGMKDQTISFVPGMQRPAKMRFEVRSLKDAEAELKARSIPFVRERSGIYVKDPDGNGIEFVAAVE